MSTEALARRRKLFGYVASALFALVVLALVDALAAQAKLEFNRLDLVPGEALAVNGPMPPGAGALSELTVATDVPKDGLSLAFSDSYSGFWYGGGMWKGELTVAPSTQPGRYALAVRGAAPAKGDPPGYIVLVHQDESARRAASTSLITRHFGLRPFLLAAILTPLALAASGAGYLVSLRLGRELARMGIAEIYMCKRGPLGAEIGFDAPDGFAVAPGSRITLLDEGGRDAGLATVTESTGRGVTALVAPGIEVGHGFRAKL